MPDNQTTTVIAAAQAVVAAWRADQIRRLPDGTPEENSAAQAALVRLADALRGHGEQKL